MGYYDTNSQEEQHDSDQFIITLKYSSEYCELNKKMPEVFEAAKSDKSIILTPDNKKELRRFAEVAALSLLINFVTSAFVGILTKKLTSKLEKKVKNRRLCRYLDWQVSQILEQHPDYIPCSMYEFKQTYGYERMASQFKDKSKIEVLKQIGKVSLNLLFDKKIGPEIIKFLLTLNIIPIPKILLQASSGVIMNLFVPVIKTVLNGVGISWNSGTLGNKLFSFKHYVFEAGLELAPVGLRIVNIKVYFFKGVEKTLISVQIPNPPDSVYTIPKKEIRENIRRFSLMNSKERHDEFKRLLKSEGE